MLPAVSPNKTTVSMLALSRPGAWLLPTVTPLQKPRSRRLLSHTHLVTLVARLGLRRPPPRRAVTPRRPVAMASSSPLARPSLEIESRRLAVRPAVASDADAFLELLTTSANFPHEAPEKGLKLERVRARIAGFAASAARGDDAFLIFVERQTDRLVGYGGYNTFQSVELGRFFQPPADAPAEGGGGGDAKRMTDIEIMLDHHCWRRGFGLELLCALVEHARSCLGCELFQAETADDNEPWRALMRAAGLGDTEGRIKASFDPSLDV